MRKRITHNLHGEIDVVNADTGKPILEPWVLTDISPTQALLKVGDGPEELVNLPNPNRWRLTSD